MAQGTQLARIGEPEPQFRTAPHNIEAEQALLGAILVNNDAFYRVSDFLDPEHFSEELHRRIFEVMTQLIAQADRRSRTQALRTRRTWPL